MSIIAWLILGLNSGFITSKMLIKRVSASFSTLFSG